MQRCAGVLQVFVACLSQQYLKSQLCLREAHLADLLQLNMVPVLLERMPWPPAGSLALVFSQLVYVDFAGKRSRLWTVHNPGTSMQESHVQR